MSLPPPRTRRPPGAADRLPTDAKGRGLKGSAGVVAVVLAEMVAGAAVVLWFSPLWSEVKPGFFKLMGVLLAVLALACWFSASSAAVAGQRAGTWSVRLGVASAGV